MQSLLSIIIAFLAMLPPPLTSLKDGDTVFTVHEQQVVSAVALGDELALSMAGELATLEDLGDHGDPVPMLTATWKDASGVTWSVSTPIISTTEQGLQRAIDLHNRLVDLQQTAHPPVRTP